MVIDTPTWVRDAVFYQIFPDRFAPSARVTKPGALEPWDAPPSNHGFKGGDLLGIVEHLDYLVDLGVTAIYMTPIFQSGSNHRYHTYDYFQVDPLLGGDAALRELLDAAHGRGMRVVLDGVFNHTGRGFWPFHHILENGPASPYRDWFHLDPDVREGRRLMLPYPPTNEYDPATLGYRAWWGLAALPKLNTDHPDVRELLFSVAEHWLRFGIDGWRLDVPTEIADPSFWATFRRRCRTVRSDAYLVGEVWEIAPEWVGPDGFDALMDYPLAESILGYVGGSTLDVAVVEAHHEYRKWLIRRDGPGFATRLVELLGAYDPDVVAVQLNLLGSHDTPRPLSVLGDDRAAIRMATLLQCTLPGAPSIYYGDEIGMTGGIDPANRGGFPWDETRWDSGLRAYVKAVIALRASEAVLRHGATLTIGAFGPAMAIERRLDRARLVIAVNPGDDRIDFEVALLEIATGRLERIPIDGEAIDWQGRSPLDSIPISDGRARIEIPARTGQIFRVAVGAA